ncbi:hypothetical protein BMETH_2072_0 [methanotrophic bacterial endosymbiont of Bathymodiolus sp.]|nr:hypothetical protein BMETH_2072_0 [methanotrophic bacterial endosymbiont of Bathymodiolus sp.]
MGTSDQRSFYALKHHAWHASLHHCAHHSIHTDSYLPAKDLSNSDIMPLQAIQNFFFLGAIFIW